MASIVVNGLNFGIVPTSVQTLTVKYRLATDPDVSASYTTVTTNLIVNPNGTSSIPLGTPINITGLTDGVAYMLVVINNCNNRGIAKQYPTTIPVTYTWVENTFACEQDTVFTQSGQVTGLSSPVTLMYDATTGLVYGVDLDNSSGNFFSYNPIGFTSSAAITYYPLTLTSGATNYIFGTVADIQYRKLYACGRDTMGVQIFDVATNSVSIINWGLNVNVAPTGSGNGFPRAVLVMLDDKILGIDKYSQTILIIDRATSTAATPISITGIPNYAKCLQGAPCIQKVGTEYWVASSQANSTEAPTKDALIHRYDAAFTTELGTIDISPYSALWSFGSYSRASYVDTVNNKYYIFDMGASYMIVIDIATHAIVYTKQFTIRQNFTNASLGFVVDPISNDLYLSGIYCNTIGGSGPSVSYKVDRLTYAVTDVYPNISFGNLTQIGSTNQLHGANPGLVAWGGGTVWSSDGAITKFTR